MDGFVRKGLARIGRILRLLTLAALAPALAACMTIPYDDGPVRPPTPYSHLNDGAGAVLEYPPTPMQCAPFARGASGIAIFGDANTWWTQADGRYQRASAPEIGAVLVLRGYNDPSRGHVAVVRSIVSSREVRVDQANWMNQGEITRNVPVLDVSPANDWSEIRMWWIPAGDWGVRVYEAEGFILPRPAYPATS